MSTIDKLKKKLNEKPVRNDMTIDEVVRPNPQSPIPISI